MTDDDFDEYWPAWLDVGTSYELSGREEPPRFRSVSPAAHRALQIGKAMQAREAAEAGRGPLGFHRPKKTPGLSTGGS